MSSEDLRALRDGHAFDPAPSLEELYQYHVPFDQLTGSRTCESPLRRALLRGEQVALVGESGCGKSSVIGHVLGPLVEGVAPLPIPVAVERPEVAADPVQFTAHLVRTVARHVERSLPREAEAAKSLAEKASPMAGGEMRRRRFAGGIGWLKARLELAAELEQMTAPQPRSSREILDQAVAILELIGSNNLQPVLVFDDTDKWFGAGIEEPDRLLDGFFGRVVRLIAEDLGATAVLAVHNGYIGHPSYSKAAGFIETTIHVPKLPDANALSRLLAHRAMGQHVLTPEALAALHAYYELSDASDIRQRVLLIIHTALSHACDDDATKIGIRHIELAVAEYGDPAGWWRGLPWPRKR